MNNYKIEAWTEFRVICIKATFPAKTLLKAVEKFHEEYPKQWKEMQITCISFEIGEENKHENSR